MKNYMYILIIIILFLIFYSLCGILLLKKAKKSTENSFQRLNNSLKERWDLLPRFINSIKYDLIAERRLIEKIILLRNTTYNNLSNVKKLDLDCRLSSCLNELFSKIENYDIKESDLENIIKKMDLIDEEIDRSRLIYKEKALQYEKLKKFFPKFFNPFIEK